MDEQEMYRIMYTGVKMTLDTLDKDELLGVLMCVQLDSDPRRRSWFEKVGHLWDQNDGRKMHDLTKDIVVRIASERLGV